jgi:hypothetical protein
VQSRDRQGAVSSGQVTSLPKRHGAPAQEILAAVDANAGLQVDPFDVEVATEVADLGDALRDPADRAMSLG